MRNHISFFFRSITNIYTTRSTQLYLWREIQNLNMDIFVFSLFLPFVRPIFVRLVVNFENHLWWLEFRLIFELKHNELQRMEHWYLPWLIIFVKSTAAKKRIYIYIRLFFSSNKLSQSVFLFLYSYSASTWGKCIRLYSWSMDVSRTERKEKKI